MHWLSRKHEFEADQFAVEHTGKGAHLISGLKKLSTENMSNLTPHFISVVLGYTHPPVLQRIAALRSHERKVNSKRKSKLKKKNKNKNNKKKNE